jgi:hypothetical protein
VLLVTNFSFSGLAAGPAIMLDRDNSSIWCRTTPAKKGQTEEIADVRQDHPVKNAINKQL